MNCTDVDLLITSARDLSTSGEDWVFATLVTSLFLVSLAFVVVGGRFVRAFAGIAGLGFGLVGTFMLTAFFQGLSCAWRLGIAAVGGVVLAALAVCIAHAAVFILGGAGGGVLAHLVYQAVAGETDRDLLSNRPPAYYVAVGGTSLACALLAFVQRTFFTRVATSVLGGGGIAFGVHTTVRRTTGTQMSDYVSIAIVAGSTAIGTAVQTRLASKRSDGRSDGRPRRRGRGVDARSDP